MSRGICYCKAMLENRTIHRSRQTKPMRKTQGQGPSLQTMYSKTPKNKEVNIHELKVLARIVTTTLRSPRGSAYNRISTAARLDSGTSPYAVGGGIYLRSRSMASWTLGSVLEFHLFNVSCANSFVSCCFFFCFVCFLQATRHQNGFRVVFFFRSETDRDGHPRCSFREVSQFQGCVVMTQMNLREWWQSIDFRARREISRRD